MCVYIHQHHCMSSKQAKLIVNAHKHNLQKIIHFATTGMFMLNNMKTTTKINQKSRETQRENAQMRCQ